MTPKAKSPKIKVPVNDLATVEGFLGIVSLRLMTSEADAISCRLVSECISILEAHLDPPDPPER
jgi:hypothetical protein